MPQAADDATFEIDHVIARKHDGATAAGNLCLSCYYCNSFKGSDLASIDREQIVPLVAPLIVSKSDEVELLQGETSTSRFYEWTANGGGSRFWGPT